jgi:hypothetical protein
MRHIATTRRWHLLYALLLSPLCLLATAARPPDDPEAQLDQIRDEKPLQATGQKLQAKGAFSCDFGIDFTKTTEPIAAEIERDRIFMQRFALEYTQPDHPGMMQKHIPIALASDTIGYAGGRYLFQGRKQAATYADFVKRRYTYPANTQFLQRTEFFDAECRDFSVIAAWRFADLDQQTVVRTERFDTGLSDPWEELALSAQLRAASQGIIDSAAAAGYAEVHVLHNMDEHKVQLNYYGRRQMPAGPSPDVAAMGAIASAAPLGAPLEGLGLTRVFDRSSFVLTVWLPFAEGDRGQASLWPGAPALPSPFCGDGVCEPSRGETNATCPSDCAPNCGDGICQADESQATCPSDCAVPLVP